MPEQNSTTVESQKEISGKTVFGAAGVNNPTPMWATWTFRIVFLLTTAATFIISGDNRIGDDVKVQIFLYMKAFDFVIWGIGRGLGVQKAQFEDK